MSATESRCLGLVPWARRVALATAAVVLCLASAAPARATTATVTVPTTLTFTVASAGTVVYGTPNLFYVTYSGVTVGEGQWISISVAASAHDFSPSGTLSATNVSWTTQSVYTGCGASATGLTFEPKEVVTCDLGSGGVGLRWALDVPAGTPAGTYTLTLQWGFVLVGDTGGGGDDS